MTLGLHCFDFQEMLREEFTPKHKSLGYSFQASLGFF